MASRENVGITSTQDLYNKYGVQPTLQQIKSGNETNVLNPIYTDQVADAQAQYDKDVANWYATNKLTPISTYNDVDVVHTPNGYFTYNGKGDRQDAQYWEFTPGYQGTTVTNPIAQATGTTEKGADSTVIGDNSRYGRSTSQYGNAADVSYLEKFGVQVKDPTGLIGTMQSGNEWFGENIAIPAIKYGSLAGVSAAIPVVGPIIASVMGTAINSGGDANLGDYLKNAAIAEGGSIIAGQTDPEYQGISSGLTDVVGETAANTIAGMTVGAGAQAAGSVLGQELTTRKIDWDKVGTSSVGGAIGSAATSLNDDLNYYLQNEKGWSPAEASAFSSGLSSVGGNALAQEIINDKINPNNLTTAAVTGLINGTLNPTEWEGIGDNPYNTTATGVTVPSSLVAAGVNAVNPQSTSTGTKAPTTTPTTTTPTPTTTTPIPTITAPTKTNQLPVSSSTTNNSNNTDNSILSSGAPIQYYNAFPQVGIAPTAQVPQNYTNNYLKLLQQLSQR